MSSTANQCSPSGYLLSSQSCVACPSGEPWIWGGNAALAMLLASNDGYSSTLSHLGLVVALSTNGQVLVAGAERDYDQKGAIYTYLRDPVTLQYVQQDWFTGASNENIGLSLAVDAAGLTLAYSSTGNSYQTMNVRYRTTVQNTWTYLQNIPKSTVGASDFSMFGKGLSLSADGSVMAVGTPGDQPYGFPQGSVYMFARNGGLGSSYSQQMPRLPCCLSPYFAWTARGCLVESSRQSSGRSWANVPFIAEEQNEKVLSEQARESCKHAVAPE